MPRYRFYWVGNNTTGNFGDVLTPKLLDHFGVDYEFTRGSDYNAICIGSIARHAKKDTLVLGSGFMSKKNPCEINADWKFVRGPRSKAKLESHGGRTSEIMGDPALLLPLFCDESKKKHDVAIIPHVSQYAWAKENFPDYHVINLKTKNALTKAKEITECRTVISSSLHGIIAAHAYGIPAAYVEFKDGIKGDGIKFEDHYESIGIKAELSTVEDPKFTTGTFDIEKIAEFFKDL